MERQLQLLARVPLRRPRVLPHTIHEIIASAIPIIPAPLGSGVEAMSKVGDTMSKSAETNIKVSPKYDCVKLVY